MTRFQKVLVLAILFVLSLVAAVLELPVFAWMLGGIFGIVMVSEEVK